MILSDSQILTAEQAAIRAGCSANWVRRVLAAGRYEGYRTFTANGEQKGKWLTTIAAADRIRAELTTRAGCNLHQRKGRRKAAPAKRPHQLRALTLTGDVATFDGMKPTLPPNVAWITTTRAAEILGCTAGRVRQLDRDGVLKTGFKVNTRLTMFDEREIVEHSRLVMIKGRPRKFASRAAY
jgi:hypothetical protein